MPTPKLHPKPDRHGNIVRIHRPDVPSDQAAWQDPNRVAIAVSCTPCAHCAGHIGGVQVQPWTDAPKDAAGWEALVAGLDFHEPPMPKVPGKKPAAGAVVIEPDGRVWLVAPTNQYGGYRYTFPKGKLDGMSPHATAIKETWEESGLQVKLAGYLCDSERSTSVTRYYTARRIGGSPADMGWESQAVLLVPAAKLRQFASHPNDALIVSRAQEKSIVAYEFGLASGHRVLDTLAGYLAKFGEWPTLVRMPVGMAVGLRETVLTPHGWGLLNDRLEVVGEETYDIYAEGGNGQIHQYDAEGPLTLHSRASIWVWGVDLSVNRGG